MVAGEGILVSRGVQLRIPAGGLTVTLDGDPPPVVFEVRLDVWDHWLAIASELTQASESAHARLLDAVRRTDEQARNAALEEEFRAAMQAIGATAFAVDAVYAAVKERFPIEPEVELAWRRKRTARDRRIAEVLKRAFGIKRERRSSRRISTACLSSDPGRSIPQATSAGPSCTPISGYTSNGAS